MELIEKKGPRSRTLTTGDFFVKPFFFKKIYSGGSEQVKQVKQLLHRKSEADKLIFWGKRAKKLAIFEVASPEIILFLRP